MAKQTVNPGTAPTGAGGDTFRSGSLKLQQNDDEIYTQLGADSAGKLPTALPVTKGGTGAVTAAAARTNLGLGDAATYTVGTNNGNVPLVQNNGFLGAGWGGTTLNTYANNDVGSIAKDTRGGAYSHTSTTTDNTSSFGTSSFNMMNGVSLFINRGDVAFRLKFTNNLSLPPVLQYIGNIATTPTLQKEYHLVQNGGSNIIYNATSASSANVVINSDGTFSRSTSSLRYKYDVEDIELKRALELKNISAIWYRSECQCDNPEHSFYSFGAETVAAIDPRLAFFKTHEFVEEKAIDENGEEQINVFEKKLETPIPDGINLQAIVAMQHTLIQDLYAKLETLEGKVNDTE